MNHTPEPWLLAEDDPTVVYAPNSKPRQAGVCICVAHAYEVKKGVTFKPVDDAEERRANAAVIAAAPKLLAALKHAVACVEYCRRFHKDAQSGEGIPVEALWKALIAEASGSEPPSGAAAEARLQ